MDTAPPRGPVASAPAARGRLRNLNLVMILPVITAAGVLLVATDARNWVQALVLGTGLAAGLLTFVCWASGALFRVAVPCLVVTAAVWVYGVTADCQSAFYGLSITGPHVVSRLRHHRVAAAVALVAFVAVVGAARLLVTQGNVLDDVVAFVIVPTGVTGVVTGLMFPNRRFYEVVEELEESREREAELAVIRERVRFASDLHDIQGHTLHVVKLKIALAQKLVHSDTARVEQELREIHALVSDTITQTKELAYAQRRLNLSAELENAKNLFEAAGIRVRVDRLASDTGAADPSPAPDTATDARTSALLGQVLRETTTNILRHADATWVRVTLSGSGITVVNNGAAPKGPPPELRGLAALRRRVADDGGELVVERRDGRFTTAAVFPARPAPGGSAPVTDGRPTPATPKRKDDDR